MHTLFISDHRLQLFAQDLVCQSHGYALLAGERVLFDIDESVAPIQQVRLQPEKVNSRYWLYCDESGIASNAAGLRHSADLVFKHLQALQLKHEIDALTLVVPSHYQAHQLQLLIGIAQAAGMQPMRVINKAVLVSASVLKDATQPLALVDIGLNQTVVSFVQASGNGLELESHEVIAGCSISKLQDALMNRVQANFIEQDRFDPLHHASTEQQLFDQLDAAAHAIKQHGVASVTVDFKQKVYMQSIDEALWHQATAACFAALPALSGYKVVIDINGAFNDQLIEQSAARHFAERSMAPSAANLLAVAQHVESLSDQDGIPFITQLPLAPSAVEAATPQSIEAVSAQDSAVATHVVCNGVARPIDRAAVGFKAGNLSFVDAAPNLLAWLKQAKLKSVAGATLVSPLPVGERLVSELGDGVLTLIRVDE